MQQTAGPVRAIWAHASGKGTYAGSTSHHSAADARAAGGYPYRLIRLEEIGGPVWRHPAESTVEIARRAAHEAALEMAQRRMDYYYTHWRKLDYAAVSRATWRLQRASGIAFDSRLIRSPYVPMQVAP